MKNETLRELEQLFLALSDKTRLALLGLMAAGPVSVGYLADSLELSQPKISRHLAYLRSSGLVSTRRDGKWIYYGIELPSSSSARHVLAETLALLSSSEPVPIRYPQTFTPEPRAGSEDREEMAVHLL